MGSFIKSMQSNGLPVTEYAANPLPSEVHSTSAKGSLLVPPDFLGPDGYPDVRNPLNVLDTFPLTHQQYLRLILTSSVYDVIEATPLTHAVNLSNRLECNVLLKREDLQPIFSFKIRGAYNKMANLDPTDRWKGVVACSAGKLTMLSTLNVRTKRIRQSCPGSSLLSAKIENSCNHRHAGRNSGY